MTAQIPQRMRCIEITKPGGPDVLVLGERAVPQPKTGEVLIRVQAAGVNRPDVLQRMGLYPVPPGASDVPGLEIAGVVVACGADVQTPHIGDAVCALVAGGGYAAFATAPATSCLPLPTGMDASTAAAIPETYFTVWQNVFERGALRAGETLLVHGGSSGIGTTAIQLAKAFGAKVATTVGSDEKAAACRKLGADLVVNYRNEDFVAAIKGSPLKGADVVLDMVGGSYTPRNLECLNTEGRLVQIAFIESTKTTVDLRPVMLKRLTITGSTLRARDTAFKGALAATLRAKVWPFLDRGVAVPMIDSLFPLAEAAKAHARMESSAHIGKIVLTMS